MDLNKSITIIIRVTEACNLSCSYCYIKPATKNKFLPLPQLAQMLNDLCQLGYTYIDFIWHGGEPLLPSLDYYKKAVELQQEIIRENSIHIQNRMQTNATLLNTEWVNFFDLHDFKIGISIDGPEPINDEYRRYHSGKLTYKDISNGIDLIKSSQCKTNILSVLTRNEIQNMAAHYEFIKTLEVDGFKVNPCFVNKEDQPNLQVHPLDWGSAMIELFDLWYHDSSPPACREFEEIIASMFTGTSNLCMFNTTCFENFISVVPSGDVFPCARLINENPSFHLGNIADMQDALHRLSDLDRDYEKIGCQECEWNPICKGGCTAYAYWANGEINTKDHLCEGYKMFFAHVKNTVSQEADSLLV